MATLRYVMFCKSSIVDQRNNLSIIEIFDEVQIPELPDELKASTPMLPLNFSIVCVWDRSDVDIPEKIDTRVTFLAPTGKKFGGAEVSVDLSTMLSSRVMSDALGIPYHGAGRYVCNVDIRVNGKRWRRCGTARFLLKQVPTLPAPKIN